MAPVYGIKADVLDNKRIKYFTKALKVNRSLSMIKCNIMDIPTLKQFLQVCIGYSNS